MEQTSIERLNKLHPKIRKKALDAYNEAVKVTPIGVHPFITETMRSFERSDALYNQPWDGKDNDGDGKIDEADEKVTKAKGGSSYHNYGLAIDFVNQVNGKTPWKVDDNWMKVVNVFKKHGFKWGGDPDFGIYDAPHFQMTLGYNWKQLLALKNAGKIDKDGYVLI